MRNDTVALRESIEIRNVPECCRGFIFGREARDEKETEFMNGKSKGKSLPNIVPFVPVASSYSTGSLPYQCTLYQC